ncbi:hypothetical protein A2V71_00415 [Candidatus Berkelbacteria bacterium RBG_13_40_8]|uniref:Glycerophosphoryl diester phosphodiesterase membrane domain-containing protein n=1 Tax=Candidatus Berkelbacteria bacterium RBG_13_40_8 TaxID=1797467 RepID=A0A1F5DM25_9BACT|nr:MAG: hypothetical protein A2V71_00415 [Candidatus Berkelbacteria bacterium RBG_13_40_8]
MDYFGIVKRAYYITLKNKFLWIFGILAGGYGGFKGFSFNAPTYQTGNADWSKFTDSINSTDFSNFWLNYSGIILTIIVIFLIFAFICFALNVISQGALVGSVAKLDKQEKANFRVGFGIGWHNFWRILGVAITYLLMILISLIILVVPVAVAIMAEGFIFAIVWGILIFFLCLAFWILIALISPFSLRVIVLKKLGVFESIRDSLHFFRDHWLNIIVMYLLLLAIGIGFGIALALALLIVGGILLALGFGVWLASPIVAIIYGIIMGVAVFVAMVVLSGAFNTFYSGALTITYQKLAKKTA